MTVTEKNREGLNGQTITCQTTTALIFKKFE